MGSFASLWTPDTAGDTFQVLAAGLGAGQTQRVTYWKYTNPQTENPYGPYLSGGRGNAPPYGLNFEQAKDALQIPKTPTDVNKVNVPWYEPVRGPRPVQGNEQWGQGGGPEYYRGWRWPE